MEGNTDKKKPQNTIASGDGEQPDDINRVQRMLENYGIRVQGIEAVHGASVSEYRLDLKPGQKISTLKSLSPDFAIGLNVKGVRVRAADGYAALEIPNNNRRTVLFSDLEGSEEFMHMGAALPVIIGETIGGRCRCADLAALPHLLIAGATKQGKSMAMKSMMLSILQSTCPDDARFVLIDSKNADLSAFASMPQDRFFPLEGSSAVSTTRQQALDTLEALCKEMDRRLQTFEAAGCRSISTYRNMRSGSRPDLPAMPYIVCLIDEFADFTLSASRRRDETAKGVMTGIIRLAQKGARSGIHMVISTQRPCTDAITGILKANFPARLAFRTAGRVDSMVILDTPGAELLTGEGDCLFCEGVDCERLQAPCVTEEDIRRLVTSREND